MSDLCYWLSGMVLGFTVGYQWQVFRWRAFARQLERETMACFDRLCREWADEQERLNTPPAWFPGEECGR